MGVQAFCLGLPLGFCLFLEIVKISDSITQFIDFDSIFRSFNCFSIFSAPFELSSHLDFPASLKIFILSALSLGILRHNGAKCLESLRVNTFLQKTHVSGQNLKKSSYK